MAGWIFVRMNAFLVRFCSVTLTLWILDEEMNGPVSKMSETSGDHDMPEKLLVGRGM